MESFQECRRRAERNLQIAEHMLTVTYPLLKDAKLLLGVTENIFLGITNSMSAVVFFERKYKRIPPFHDNFESKFNTFTARIVPRYGIDKKYIILLKAIKEIVLKHKQSPIEFARKGKFVICDEKYNNVRQITDQELRQHLNDAKEFHQISKRLVARSESFFTKRKAIREIGKKR
ncbi:hypothetical protein KY336_00310 [Candidatus Woesearchaeota archaeon]|nr:hypothetical protein [Candidatus Woesearchaeota archaeon]